MKTEILKSEKTSASDQWGIPDWMDPSAYPHPEKANEELWKWEFLRRREDYREDWMTFAERTYKRHLKEAKASNGKMSGWKPYLHNMGNPKKTPKDLEFVAEMPNAYGKYGLLYLPNPANPYPDVLEQCWPVEETSFRGGEGYLENLWGMEYVLFQHEVAFRFDLRTEPVEQLCSPFMEKLSLHETMRGDFSKLKPTASQLNLLWDRDDLRGISKWKGPPNTPRILLDPKTTGVVHVIFDVTQPYLLQWEEAKKWMKMLQRKRVGKVKAQRCHPFIWQDYLRILDAREINQETGKELATYEEIGRVILRIKKNSKKAKARGKQAHKAACQLRDKFPY